MKNLKQILLVSVMIIVATIFFNTKAKAWPLPQLYLTFIWDTPTSGWLWCSGDGTCAEVIGSTIYFGDGLSGNWHGYQPVEEGEISYYIDDVVQE